MKSLWTVVAKNNSKEVGIWYISVNTVNTLDRIDDNLSLMCWSNSINSIYDQKLQATCALNVSYMVYGSVKYNYEQPR